MANHDTFEINMVENCLMFGGQQSRFQHKSATLGCNMTFTVFVPSPSFAKFPVLYWLSDADSNDQKFLLEALPHQAAAFYGIAIVAPDTYPRELYKESVGRKGVNVDEKHAGGKGINVDTRFCGYYLNGKQSKLYNWMMYDYVVKELPSIINKNFKDIDCSQSSISGFSTGGHAALMIYLENCEKYKSVSAFAPVTNPINSSLDQEVFSEFLGTNISEWEKYDATCLIRSSQKSLNPIMIEQGTADIYYDERLRLHNFKQACCDASAPLIVKMRPGYAHDHFFIATFIDLHIAHHAKYFGNSESESLTTQNAHPTESSNFSRSLHAPGSSQRHQDGLLKGKKRKGAEERPIEFKLSRKEWKVFEKRGYFELTNPYLPNVDVESVFFEDYGNEYCLQVMQATNHRNILSLGVVNRNTSSVGDESALFRYVEDYRLAVGCDTTHWFSLKYLACPNNQLPSQAFQNMTSQIMEGLDHLHQKGFCHGNLSWNSVVHSSEKSTSSFKLTNFKKTELKDIEYAKLRDWNNLGDMLMEVSEEVMTKTANMVPTYDCTLVNELALFLADFSDRTALRVLKEKALEFLFFWDQTKRSHFFRIEVSKALKCDEFCNMVADSPDVCSLPWDSDMLRQLKLAMDDYREEHQLPDYKTDKRLHFVQLVCAAYTHEKEILKKKNLHVDTIIQLACRRLCSALKRIIALNT